MKMIKSKSLFLLLGGVILSLTSLISCKEKEQEAEFIDYVHTSDVVRLTHDYKDTNGNNRDFFKDGISQVTPRYYIDGDTTHFVMKDSSNQELIKARYYGIDTPESTANVEPYGKDAAEFTKTKLEEAKTNGTVVITSTSLDSYAAPETDSTGSRYLSLVWINTEKKDAPYNELYLLNLWIVQEGYSYVKGLDKFEDFKPVFLDAEAQARSFKLKLFSGKDDPRYNYGDYQDVSLKALNEEVVKSLKDPSYENKYENAKVRVRGTVAGYTNKILYLQAAYQDDETGKMSYAGINIYTGMSSIPEKYRIVNTYIQVSGLALTSENFGFQISDVKNWPKASAKDENDAQVLYSAKEIPEEYKIKDTLLPASTLNNNYDYLFQGVEVEENVTIYDGYDSDSTPVNVTLKGKVNGEDVPFSIYIPFLYQPDENDSITKYKTYKEYVGKTYKVKGIYSFHKSLKGNISFQVILRNSSDLVLVE